MTCKRFENAVCSILTTPDLAHSNPPSMSPSPKPNPSPICISGPCPSSSRNPKHNPKLNSSRKVITAVSINVFCSASRAVKKIANP